MKKFIFLSVVFLSAFVNSSVLLATAKSISGAGLIIGSPTGINAKHFLEKKGAAVEGDFSVVSGKLYLTASYLWHDFSAFPKIEEGELPLFYGISVAVVGNDAAVGGAIGVSYLFKDYPFDVFIKLSPVIVFEKNTTLTFIGGIGGRYFFK